MVAGIDAARLALAAALAAGALASGCARVERRVKDGAVRETLDQAPARGSFVEAVGIGASDPALPTETQRKALARDAAIVKAQYELLSMVKGVTLDGGVTVARALETDSTLEARLRETVRGAEVVRSEFTKDGGCVVTLRLPKRRLAHLMGVDFR